MRTVLLHFATANIAPFIMFANFFTHFHENYFCSKLSYLCNSIIIIQNAMDNKVGVLGIGNALVDIVTHLNSDETLNQLELPKGSMQLVDENTMAGIALATKDLSQKLASGGSAANTINGLANLGVHTSFIGKVGNDNLGEFFVSDMKSAGIKPMVLQSPLSTGSALALVSPDAERTFAVNLGAALELAPSDLHPEQFSPYQYFHIEGYLVQNHELIEKALQLAKKEGLIVSLDLASYNVVEENLSFLKRIVTEYVDIVFANEEEAKSFTGKNPHEALKEIASMCKIAVVKLGAQGSIIQKGEETQKVGVIQVNPVDSTGAGDMYAAGFIYGQSLGLSLNQCGQMGALLSGSVMEVVGPKMSEVTWKKLRVLIARIKDGESIVQ